MSGRQPDAVETQLQALLSKGDYRAALERMAHAHVDTVFRYCFRMLHADRLRATDVTQQVFEEVCKGITKYRGDASVKTWLLAVAHKQCLKEIDTRQRRGSMLQAHQDSIAAMAHAEATPSSESALLTQEGLAQLRGALERLNPEARSLLMLRFGIDMEHELSIVEIANVLGLSRAAAYRKLQEALQCLRRIMHDGSA